MNLSSCIYLSYIPVEILPPPQSKLADMKQLFIRATLLLPLSFYFIRTISAQDNKSIDEAWNDLKSTFNHTKAFVLPITDTSDQRISKFTMAVRAIPGVKKVTLISLNGKTQLKVDSKLSMNELWKALPDEIHTTYSAGERKGDGVTITPSASKASVGGSNGINDVYKQAEQDADKEYQKPSSSNKSILQQQRDHAEEMRARDKKMAQEIYGKNRNLYFNNPEKPDTLSSVGRGQWFVEYTFNGKKVTINREMNQVLSLRAGKESTNLNFYFMVPKPFQQVAITFTNLAFYPDVRRFEFNKPTVYSRAFKMMYDKPELPTSEKSPVKFYFDASISDPSSSPDVYHVSTFDQGDSLNKSPSKIESGYFEILYFESRENGIVEGKFEYTARQIGNGWGKKKDIIIKNGRFRFRLDQVGINSKEAEAAKAAKEKEKAAKAANANKNVQ